MTTPISAADASMRSRGAAHARGFTLLELLVVLALILLGVGLVIPNVASSDNSRFNAQVRQAVSMLRYARRVAIVDAQPQRVHLQALDPTAIDFAIQQAQAIAARRDTDWLSDSISLAYQSELNQPTEPQDSIDVLFFPQGGSTGGVVSFVQGERLAQVRVDPLTGRIAAAYNGESLDEEALDASF